MQIARSVVAGVKRWLDVAGGVKRLMGVAAGVKRWRTCWFDRNEHKKVSGCLATWDFFAMMTVYNEVVRDYDIFRH